MLVVLKVGQNTVSGYELKAATLLSGDSDWSPGTGLLEEATKNDLPSGYLQAIFLGQPKTVKTVFIPLSFYRLPIGNDKKDVLWSDDLLHALADEQILFVDYQKPYDGEEDIPD